MLVSQPPPPYIGYMFTDDYARERIDPLYVETSMINAGTESNPDAGLRMGTLYDFIQNWTGHPEHDSAWFRVVWGQPREPYVSPICLSKGQELLQQTNVIVEFALRHMGYGQQEPRDEAEFDRHFRSKDHQDLQVGLVERTKEDDEHSEGVMNDMLMVL